MYPYGEMAGAVLGYIGKDGGGLGGVEFFFERYLKAKTAGRSLTATARTTPTRNRPAQQRAPKRERRVLDNSIDMQRSLKTPCNRRSPVSGRAAECAIVMEPSTEKYWRWPMSLHLTRTSPTGYPVGSVLTNASTTPMNRGRRSKAGQPRPARSRKILKRKRIRWTAIEAFMRGRGDPFERRPGSRDCSDAFV